MGTMACQGYQVTAGTANETYLDELENVAWFLAALWAYRVCVWAHASIDEGHEWIEESLVSLPGQI